MSEYLSYAQFLKDRNEFRKSGSRSGQKFNLYDTPAHKYFKILFYFGSSNEISNKYGDSNGLLHPTWDIFNERSEMDKNGITLGMNSLNYYDYNSAWSYLKMNNEEERAEKLEKFISLLSNINSYSPWYFTNIGGLDSALERKGPDNGKIEIVEPGKITITCLPDSFDNRIGTLLDLYRDITWSWINKKEIIPANLRKFDMAIYIFETPAEYWHNTDEKNSDELDSISEYVPSYKMIEFHDCEFSYNSIKSGWSELNNIEGVSPKYTIEISYNDCYEISYNEFILRTIGDVIKTDTYVSVINEDGINIASQDTLISTPQIDDIKTDKELKRRQSLPNIEYTKNSEENKTKTGFDFIKNIIEQGAGYVTDIVKEKINRALLGNLHTYSLTKIGSQLTDLEKGNLIKTGQSVKQYIKESQQRKQQPQHASGNIFPDQNTTRQAPTGDLFPDQNTTRQAPTGDLFPDQNTVKKQPNGVIFQNPIKAKPIGSPIGNIFSKSTIANNI